MNLIEIIVEALTDFLEQSAETIGTFLSSKDEKPDHKKINALLGIPDPPDDAFARLLAREKAAKAAAEAAVGTAKGEKAEESSAGEDHPGEDHGKS